jgi:protein-arginine kinase activator protein McsA
MTGIALLQCDNCSERETLIDPATVVTERDKVIAGILTHHNHSLTSVRVDGEEQLLCEECIRELDLTDADVEYL